MHNPKSKRGRRFYSKKNATAFCKAVNGRLIDLTSDNNTTTNFKIVYTKEDAKRGMK